MSKSEVRAAVLFGPRDIRVVTRPPARVGRSELRVALEHYRISERDVQLWASPPEAAVPLQLGSELVGTVTEVGRGLRGRGDLFGRSVGDRVEVWVPSHELVSARKRQVMGLADEVVADWRNCQPIRKDVPAAALAAEPLANLMEVLWLAHGERGPDQISGLHYVFVGGGLEAALLIKQLQKVYSPRSITAVDPRSDERQLAARAGATHTAAPPDALSVVAQATAQHGADVVLELTGTPEGAEIARRSARRDGHLLDVARVPAPGVGTLTSTGVGLTNRRFMGQKFPLDRIGEAFAEAERGVRKVFVTP